LTVQHRTVSAAWERPEAREGEVATLKALLRGIPDGDSATIRVYEKQWRGGHSKHVDTLSAVVKDAAVEQNWTVPVAGKPLARGDSGRRDFYYVVEVGGLQSTSSHVVVLPASNQDMTLVNP
jgi:hypothetical protein